MPRPKNTLPKFCVDKSGRAFTKVDGRFFSLGRADSPQSRLKFANLLEQHTTGQLKAKAEAKRPDKKQITLAEMLVIFATKELPRYSVAEQHCQRGAIRILRQTFGTLPAADFGPLRLRVVREAMVQGDLKATDDAGKPCPRKPWTRNTVNRQVKRIQSIFRWAVSWELVPESVAATLSTVRILNEGETTAAESVPRLPVSIADFQKVRAELKPLYQDLLDLLSVTGARPGELVALTMSDIDRSGEVWKAELKKHKTAHKGKRRVLFFNVTAQKILLRYFKASPDAKLFPCRRDNFGAAVRKACKKTGVKFVPHAIRHTAATKLVDEVGLESTQQLLGHSDAAMTRHYSAKADKQATEAAKRLG